MDENATLQYAPINVANLASVKVANRLMWLALTITPVGFAFLGLYSLTAYQIVAQGGLTWAAIGAMGGMAITFSALILLIVNRNALNFRTVAVRYALAILFCIPIYPSIQICLREGASLSRRAHFRLVVYNDTATRLEKVTVHFDGGDVIVGPIVPGSHASSGLEWVDHGSRPLEITTQVGGRTRRKMDRIYCNWECLTGPYFNIHVEKAELPKP